MFDLNAVANAFIHSDTKGVMVGHAESTCFSIEKGSKVIAADLGRYADYN